MANPLSSDTKIPIQYCDFMSLKIMALKGLTKNEIFITGPGFDFLSSVL